MNEINSKKRLKYVAAIFLAIFCGALIVAGIFILQNSLRTPQWGDLEIDSIHLNGTSSNFSVRDGKIYEDAKEISWIANYSEYERVLKLALFFQWEKENPLLFDPSLDIASFDQSIDRMNQQNDAWNSKTQLGDINPVTFLQSFLDVSRAFQKLQADVSEENAQNLVVVMTHAQRNYDANVMRMKRYFDDAVAKGLGNASIAFFGGESRASTSLIKGDFQLMKQNSDLLNDEIARRKNCLENMRCARPILDTAKPQVQASVEDNLPSILPLEESVLEHETVEHGPFIIHSSCWKGRDVDLIYEAKNCNLLYETYCVDWPFLSDGEYWVKTTDVGLEKTMRANGIERRLQSASAPYQCLDQTYKSVLRSMGSAMERFKDNKFFSGNAPEISDSRLQTEVKEIWRTGLDAERKFYDAQYPSDTDLRNMVRYYEYAYGFLAKRDLFESQVRSELLQRIIVLNGNMQGISLILDRATYHLANYLNKEMNIEAAKNNPQYVFNIRSDYATTFLNFSPYVWFNSQSLKYFDQQLIVKNSNVKDAPFINYQEAVQIYGKDILKQWAEKADEIRNNSPRNKQ